MIGQYKKNLQIFKPFFSGNLSRSLYDVVLKMMTSGKVFLFLRVLTISIRLENVALNSKYISNLQLLFFLDGLLSMCSINELLT